MWIAVVPVDGGAVPSAQKQLMLLSWEMWLPHANTRLEMRKFEKTRIEEVVASNSSNPSNVLVCSSDILATLVIFWYILVILAML